MRSIGITDTTLRDSHHSLRTSRFETDELIPLAEAMDSVGFASAEAWGGASFDVCLRRLREDPWERLRRYHGALKRTPIRMLLRGQNLVGYRPYPTDLQKEFIRLAAGNGVREVRMFDALNDPANLAPAIGFARAEGMKVLACLIYSQSPFHTDDSFVEAAAALKEEGADMISLMDVWGILTPVVVTRLVRKIKAETGLPIHLHFRSSTGTAAICYHAGVEAGADEIDCPIAAFSLSSTQPASETMFSLMDEGGFDTGINGEDLKRLSKITEKMAVRHVMGRSERALFEMAVTVHKISSGMVANIINLLRAHNAEEKMPEVLEEVTRVRIEFGWPPLITPISQMVASQAVFNCLLGERYKIVSRDVIDYFRGFYGAPPGATDPEVSAKILGDKTPISGRPSVLLKRELIGAREELEKTGLMRSEEDVVTYALFGEAALTYFRFREDPSSVPPIDPDKPAKAREDIDLERLRTLMESRGLLELEIETENLKYRLKKPRPRSVGAAIPGAAIPGAAIPGAAPDASPAASAASGPGVPSEPPPRRGRPVRSPLGGTLYRAPSPTSPPFVEAGDEVDEETIVCLIEAMKLFNEIKAGMKGRVVEFAVGNGESVRKDDILLYIE